MNIITHCSQATFNDQQRTTIVRYSSLFLYSSHDYGKHTVHITYFSLHVSELIGYDLGKILISLLLTSNHWETFDYEMNIINLN